MNVPDIISKALVQYDSCQPVIRYLLKHTTLEGTKSPNDLKRTIFKFTDKKTGEMVLETEVENFAIYYDKHRVWSWAWSHVALNNAENYLAKELVTYAFTLGTELSYIKSILLTSRGTMQDLTQIDINLAIGSHLIKNSYIYPYIYNIENHNLYYYFVLLNRTRLDEIARELQL